MRQLLLSFIVCIGLAGSALAQSREITGTIDAQIEAFLDEDLDRAFSYASPGIRRVFQTPEKFGAMVRGGFPMVWRPAEVQYLELRDVAGKLWQKVRITDAAGQVHLLDYQMVNLESSWKINAVQILKVPDGTV